MKRTLVTDKTARQEAARASSRRWLGPFSLWIKLKPRVRVANRMGRTVHAGSAQGRGDTAGRWWDRQQAGGACYHHAFASHLPTDLSMVRLQMTAKGGTSCDGPASLIDSGLNLQKISRPVVVAQYPNT